MNFIIEGSGTEGYKADVTKEGRVKAFALSESILESAARDGNSFNINTGAITLTSAGESAILYIKNTEEKNLVITSIGYLLGDSTGGTGECYGRVYADPTAGTIISGATAVDISKNKNFGLKKTLSADQYKGAEGLTQSGGVQAYESLLPGAGRSYSIATGGIHLPKDISMCITFQPPAGNTSMTMEVFLAVIIDA